MMFPVTSSSYALFKNNLSHSNLRFGNRDTLEVGDQVQLTREGKHYLSFQEPDPPLTAQEKNSSFVIVSLPEGLNGPQFVLLEHPTKRGGVVKVPVNQVQVAERKKLPVVKPSKPVVKLQDKVEGLIKVNPERPLITAEEGRRTFTVHSGDDAGTYLLRNSGGSAAKPPVKKPPVKKRSLLERLFFFLR
jgi:hypothetical protein